MVSTRTNMSSKLLGKCLTLPTRLRLSLSINEGLFSRHVCYRQQVCDDSNWCTSTLMLAQIHDLENTNVQGV